MGETVEALVEAGKANAGPPLGPALGPSGVNVKAVIDEINAKTKAMAGMKVPVKVKVADDKSFSVSVGTLLPAGEGGNHHPRQQEDNVVGEDGPEHPLGLYVVDLLAE